jgi:hypothetical protein
MKKYLFILIAILVFPAISQASVIPKFPMAFYGTVTINNNTAPSGTIVRAYYGSDLAGQSTVDDSGYYGYASSTAKKLLIGEGVGPITFTFQATSVLSGKESLGSTTLSYTGFEEGTSKLNNLNFIYNIPVVVPVAPVVINTGGGGGGGGGYVPTPASTSTIVSTSTLVTAPATDVGCAPGYLFSITTGKPCLVGGVTGKVLGATTFKFTKTLKKGITSDDVKELQDRLRVEKFFTLSSSTRFFGGVTFNAVKKYQKAHKLPATGFVGPLTITELNK